MNDFNTPPCFSTKVHFHSGLFIKSELGKGVPMLMRIVKYLELFSFYMLDNQVIIHSDGLTKIPLFFGHYNNVKEKYYGFTIGPFIEGEFVWCSERSDFAFSSKESNRFWGIFYPLGKVGHILIES